VDPLTGEQIRVTRRSDSRYEHAEPGSLVHADVKKLGRIPDGGGWRAHGRSEEVRGRGVGYDFVHARIDDQSRFAYAEVLPDERAETCAAFFTRAAAAFAAGNDQRADALAPWLLRYNTTRPHHALGRQAPITRLTVTKVTAE